MSHGGDDDGKLDLVPLIDTVMLLLLFFIMTSKFTSEEKAISSLLPTDKGQLSQPQTKTVEEVKQINICIYPKGMVDGFEPSGYRDQLATMREGGASIDNATLRIGGNRMEIDGKVLDIKEHAVLTRHMADIHGMIAQSLASYETGGGERKDQLPVIIHCFSGMSWRFALVAYDAVRAYEGSRQPGFVYTGDPKQLDNAREVTFAPPRIRNYSANELGNELYEIVRLK
jgi:hypothetical protein